MSKKSQDTRKELQHKSFNKKVLLGIICATFILIAIVVVIFVLVLGNKANEITDATTEQDNASEQEVIEDFGQKITSEDGGDFDAVYELGDKTDFVMRFSDLQCTENCANVSELKINDDILALDKDYQVRQGSVIVAIFGEAMEKLKVGEYKITFIYTNERQKSLIGTNITIKDEVPACDSGQVLENNKCVDKKTESSTSASSSQKPSSSQSNNIPTDWRGHPLVDYSTGVAAYALPNAKLGSRTEFNTTGGWEKALFDLYGEYLYRLKEGYDTSTVGQSGLCFASLTADMNTLTITYAEWDTQPTSTCDYVRNENAPIPSKEYLTSYFRKIAKSDCFKNNVNWLYCRNPQW